MASRRQSATMIRKPGTEFENPATPRARRICFRVAPGQGPLMDLLIWGAFARPKRCVFRMLIVQFNPPDRLHAYPALLSDL